MVLRKVTFVTKLPLFYFKAHTVSMFLLKAACTPTVATALRAAAKREVGENGKKTQETAAIERRLL